MSSRWTKTIQVCLYKINLNELLIALSRKACCAEKKKNHDRNIYNTVSNFRVRFTCTSNATRSAVEQMRLTFEWRNKIISVIHKSKLDFPYALTGHHTVVFVCDMNFKNPLMASRSLQKLIKNGRLLQNWCLAWLLSVAAKPSHMVKMAVVAAESKACHVLLLLNRLRC